MRTSLILFLLLALMPTAAMAGPYAPAAGEEGSTAVALDDPAIQGWASSYLDYLPGAQADAVWQSPEKALGPAQGGAFDIVCLGRGGRITLVFDPPIENGEDFDFAVFENSIDDKFLELAFVEVSSNGVDFARFPSVSLTDSPVPAYGGIDPSDVHNLAGKYRQGYGTPFDLSDLAGQEAVIDGLLDLSKVAFVRLIDVVGDGSATDSLGNPIYDPYPTTGSAGFDLDAVAALHLADDTGGGNTPPAAPGLLSPVDGAEGITLFPNLMSGPFSDADPGDFHLLTGWQVAGDAAFTTELLATQSREALRNLFIAPLILSPDQLLFWRARYYDDAAAASDWAEPFSFRTTTDNPDASGDGVPDSLEPGPSADANRDGIPDRDQRSVDFIALAAITGRDAAILGQSEAVAEITSATSVAAGLFPAYGETPAETEFGVLGARILTKNPGDQIQIRIYLDPAPGDNADWSLFEPSGGWRAAGSLASKMGDGSVLLNIQDGGPGDADGTANSVLVMHAAATASDEEIPESGSSGFGGGGPGCTASPGAGFGMEWLGLAALAWIFKRKGKGAA